METALVYNIGITLLEKVGNITAKKLISYCGGSENVFKESKRALKKIPGINNSLVDTIVNSKVLIRAEEEIKFIEKSKIRPVFFLDKDYPKRLLHCDDSPVMLYVKGMVNFNNPRVLAIVGTRESTEYGKIVTENFIADLEATGVLILSGMAYGIDICAHRSALQAGLPTVGVLGHSLDRIYPQAHASTAKEMMEKGALISEYISGTKPDRENFPMRNRIVAGMSDAVLVVESATKGGSLITAEIANSYNRDVFAVPGRTNDKLSEGCNWLIKRNKAGLAESAEDIIQSLGWETNTSTKTVQRELFIDLDGDEKKLYDIIQANEKISIDDISLESKLSMSKTSTSLLNLEFKGVVKSLPGKVYMVV